SCTRTTGKTRCAKSPCSCRPKPATTAPTTWSAAAATRTLTAGSNTMPTRKPAGNGPRISRRTSSPRTKRRRTTGSGICPSIRTIQTSKSKPRTTVILKRHHNERNPIMIEATQAMEQLLAGLGEAARFESVGQVPAVLPGLEVHGIGSIGVPVAPADAKRIIGKARQAPYGLGEATIVDTEVRRVWQLEPSKFELRNAAWSAAVAGVVDAVKGDLGIRGKVTAELYKLLVYEKGSFFKPHRDTEKIPGMFGTLVVCLPSRHEGGTLILEHDGQKKQIDFGGKDSEFQTRYVAFYADCRHEVTPVKSGYRVCLVYNLAGAGKKQPAAPHHAETVAAA